MSETGDGQVFRMTMDQLVGGDVIAWYAEQHTRFRRLYAKAPVVMEASQEFLERTRKEPALLDALKYTGVGGYLPGDFARPGASVSLRVLCALFGLEAIRINPACDPPVLAWQGAEEGPSRLGPVQTFATVRAGDDVVVAVETLWTHTPTTPREDNVWDRARATILAAHAADEQLIRRFRASVSELMRGCCMCGGKGRYTNEAEFEVAADNPRVAVSTLLNCERCVRAAELLSDSRGRVG